MDAQGRPIRAARDGTATAWGVLMIVAGVAALLLPFAAGLGISVVVAWLVIAGGALHLAYTFSARGAGRIVWNLVIGLAYIVAGGWLALNPLVSLASLTLVLAALLFAEGVLQIAAWINLRRIHGAAWLLVDGVVTLTLGVLIAFRWPATAAWAIGTLVGINLIVSGIARLMHRTAWRRFSVIAAAPF